MPVLHVNAVPEEYRRSNEIGISVIPDPQILREFVERLNCGLDHA